MKLVSNTSPLIFLEKLAALPLLMQCFDKIYIPPAVQHELGDVELPLTIQVIPISEAGQQFVFGALGSLHTGELQAMALTRELQADYIALDDLAARRKAQRLGLNVIGTLGILQLASRKGYLPAETFTTYLDELTTKHGMYLSPSLLQKLKPF